MNEEIREGIIGEICTMVERNPGLLRIFELLDKLYRDVEKMKQELGQIQQDAQPDHLRKLQEFAETMLFSLAEIEGKRLLEQKLHEQTEIIKQKESQLKEVQEAYRQVAAARSEEEAGIRGDMEQKNELLKEIRKGLAGFCSMPKTKRWQLILNDDSIISHLKGMEQKIDLVMGTQ